MADVNMGFADEEDMLLLFDTTPDKFPWREPIAHDIERRRAQMHDALIFDALLAQGGVRRPHTLYPPHDKESLRQLLDAIDNSRYDTLKKDNLVYFLLKWHGDEKAQTFKEQKCMPPHYSALVDAYWLLDTGSDVPRAISILSDARLGREWPSKILQAISLVPDPYPLIRKYVRTVDPSLQQPDDLDMYILALADGSLWEAWQYQATYPEGNPIRSRLIERILYWCLAPKPKSKPLTQLLAFPLTPFEQNLIQQYALEPPEGFPSNSIPALQNLVCVRLIQSGHYASAIKLDRQFSVKSGDAHRKAAHERRQMMDEILTVMPVIERMLLEQELEKSGHGSQVPASLNADSGIWTPPDLTMSWEYVRSPGASISAGPSARKAPRTSDVFMDSPIPQRSGAPRFGGSIPDQPEPVQSISASRGPSARAPSAKTPSKGVSAGRIPQNASPSAQNASASVSGVKSKISLFESVGSANKARNAFYDPPISAGKKRSLGQDEARSPQGPSASFRTAPADISSVSMTAINELLGDDEDEEYVEEVEDVEMDDEPPRQEEPVEVEEQGQTAEEEEPESQPGREGLSFSLFYSSSQNTYTSPKRTARAVRTESERAAPSGVLPGSFEETEPESPASPTPAPLPTRAARHPIPEVVVKSPQRTRIPQPSTQKTQPAPAVQTRGNARPRRSTRTTSENLSRHIPGAFDDGDDNKEPEEAKAKQTTTEEEDVVAPLPSVSTAPRRTTRKPKVSKGDDEEEKKPRVTRRSSRISANGSESPESGSPVKRRTRTSTTATPKKTTRKQR